MALVKRGNRYYLRLKIGKTRHFRSTGTGDLRRAKVVAHEIEDELRAGKGTRACPTLEKWLARYTTSYLAVKDPATQVAEKRIIAAAVAIWGPQRRLNSLSSGDCHHWKQERLKRYKPNTIRTEQGILSGFFRAAVQEGLLRENPMRGVRRGRAISRSRVLSRAEQSILLAELKPAHRLSTQVLLGTGLRIHELLALRPSDIRPEGLHVLGKGKKARIVPLTKEVRELLETLAAPHTHSGSRLFPLVAQSMLQALRRACLRSNLPLLTLHDLRRTFGTRCAEKIPMPRLAKIMGHNSIQTTAQFYVHLEATDGSEQLERVNLLGTGAAVVEFPKASGG